MAQCTDFLKLALTLLLVGCAATKPMTVADVNFSDGVNKREAEALAANYLDNHNLAPNVFVTDLIENSLGWEVILHCETAHLSAVPQSWYGGFAGSVAIRYENSFRRYLAGRLYILHLNGFIEFERAVYAAGPDPCGLAKK